MTLSDKNKYMLYGAIAMLQNLKAEELIPQSEYDDFMKVINLDTQNQTKYMKLFVDTEHIEKKVIQPLKEIQAYETIPKKRGRKAIETKIIFENVPQQDSMSKIIENEDSLALQYIYC
jgi:hypothetical protein